MRPAVYSRIKSLDTGTPVLQIDFEVRAIEGNSLAQ